MDEQNITRDLSSFARSFDQMISTNDKSSSNRYHTYTERSIQYTHEEIEGIVSGGSLEAKQKLSREYFNKDGIYKRLIIYYATLLKYQGILIPNPSFGQELSTSHLKKRYFNAVNFVDKIKLPILATNCALKALVDGCYYGIFQITENGNLYVIDLPSSYCRTRFKDLEGNDIIEFNVSYFNKIVDEEERKLFLSAYPKEVQAAYKKFKKGKLSNPWVFLSTEITICFPFFFDGGPVFLSVIDDIERYKDAIDDEIERDLEEIRKIIVQKIPHMTDGRLVFEPPEAEEMHKGAVGMLKSNPNISVLTTYADVEAIVSKTSSDNLHNNLDKMLQTVYSNSGTSSQIFSSTGSSTLDTSVKNDVAMMMVLANKIAAFVTFVVNKLYSNSNINFKYSILPISYYNEKEYTEITFKTASSGYSLILPALVVGLSQKDLINVKDLENDVLDLQSKLIPPSSSFTQSGTGNPVGRPKKAEEEKSPKTLANERSLDKQTEGGSD